MRSYLALPGLILFAGLSGCANLDKSIQQRVEISEQCRAILATQPAGPSPQGRIASAFLGNVGHCDIVYGDTLLPMCSLTQIRTTYGFAPALDTADLQLKFNALQNVAMSLPEDQSLKAAITELANALTAIPSWRKLLSASQRVNQAAGTMLTSGGQPQVDAAITDQLSALKGAARDFGAALLPVPVKTELQSAFDDFDDAVLDLRTALTDLADEVWQLDLEYEKAAAVLRTTTFDQRTSLMQMASGKRKAVIERMGRVRIAQESLRRTMSELRAALSAQAQLELAAWDSNLRAQLDKLQQLLSGNYQVLLAADLQDRVMTTSRVAAWTCCTAP